jgi:tight adherence protein C
MNPQTQIILIQVGAALAAALGAWGLLTLLGSRNETADERFRRLLDQNRPGGAGAGITRRPTAKQEDLRKRLAAIAEKVGKSQSPVSNEERNKVKLELLNAGFRRESAVSVFYGIKAISLLIAAAITIPLVYSKYGWGQDGLIYMAGGIGLGMFAPSIGLSILRGRRQEQIFLTLPDALDLMVVCVEAGLGLDAAMRRVASELAESAPILCEEIAISNFQIQIGRPRKDVLRELGIRTGVNDVRALAAVLIQAERFGSSIASALRVQSESMRVKRKQLAEERAAKTAVKLLFPLVLFIFPGIFVVLVGPAAISIKQQLVK